MEPSHTTIPLLAVNIFFPILALLLESTEEVVTKKAVPDKGEVMVRDAAVALPPSSTIVNPLLAN